MLYLPAGYGRPPLTAAVPTPIYHSAAHPTAGGVPSMDCPHYSADSQRRRRRRRCAPPAALPVAVDGLGCARVARVDFQR